MDFFEDSIALNDQKLTLQVGKLAQASEVSVFARLGDTCVLVTVNKGTVAEDIDYLPLQVEYVEKLYAGGRIKGSRWVKREGRPSDEAILNARFIDRGVRPLFPKNYRRTIQVIVTLLSVDGTNAPEILAAIATSAALHISTIPWNGPLGTVRVGFVKTDGQGSFLINPTDEEQSFSQLDLVVSSTKNKIVMIETEAEELPEDTILDAVMRAKEENKKVVEFIEKIRKKVGLPKESVEEPKMDAKLLKILKKDYKKQLEEIIAKQARKEFEDESLFNSLVSEVADIPGQEFDKKTIHKAIDDLTKQIIRERILKSKKRPDGRDSDSVRNIFSEVSVLPRTHGSAIFQRGDTQVLSVVTLGSPSLEQLVETPEGEEAKRYIHHYYMPPYSLGEVGRFGFPSRREVGHGALAEKALEPVLPSQKDFPYTVRVVSEVLSSNGSTSMAATCGSSLALMDAGVPIKAPVAGIAMGLVGKSDSSFVILTDIIGMEDFTGDMDFKVAGTKNGITAVQLDVKNDGLTDKIVKETLGKAKKARLSILEKMIKVLERPRKEVSRFAPKVVVLTPPSEKIGDIIGPGGKNIRNLIARTGTQIDIAEDGKVTIAGPDKDKVDEAASFIRNMVSEVEVGQEFTGAVRRVVPFGAFVEIFPGKEGLVHVSKMGRGFVKDPEQVVNIGQKVRVKVLQIDSRGRINLQLLR